MRSPRPRDVAMEKLAVALWRDPNRSASDCAETLLGPWAASAQRQSGLQQLTVNIADDDQGPYAAGPDALIVIGLETAHGLDDVPERDTLHHLAARLDVWRILTNTVLEDPTPADCLKMISVVQRGDAVSHTQFIRHWAEQHAPLALAHHAGLCGYAQHEVRKSYTPGGQATDGIAELSFRTRADFEERFYDSEAGKAIIREDVLQFISRRAGMAALMRPNIFVG